MDGKYPEYRIFSAFRQRFADSLAREIVDADQVEGATSDVDVAVNRIARGIVVRSENLLRSLINP